MLYQFTLSSTFAGKTLAHTLSPLPPPPPFPPATLSVHTNVERRPTSLLSLGWEGKAVSVQDPLLSRQGVWVAEPCVFQREPHWCYPALCPAQLWHVRNHSWIRRGGLFFHFLFPFALPCGWEALFLVKPRKEEDRQRQSGGTTGHRHHYPPSSERQGKTEAAGVFVFFFRFVFFFFLIVVLGGALSFHLLALSVLCLVIYFSIYLVYNFLFLWATDRREREGDISSTFSPLFISLIHPFPLHHPRPSWFLLSPPVQPLFSITSSHCICHLLHPPTFTAFKSTSGITALNPFFPMNNRNHQLSDCFLFSHLFSLFFSPFFLLFLSLSSFASLIWGTLYCIYR